MKSKVYYNNSCSVCRFEINHYKKISENIQWIDISSEKKAHNDTKLNSRSLLRRLHVIKNDKLYKGIDAFILVWLDIPRYKLLGKLIKLPLIYHLFWLLYELLALFLYYKNKNQLNDLDRLYNE